MTEIYERIYFRNGDILKIYSSSNKINKNLKQYMYIYLDIHKQNIFYFVFIFTTFTFNAFLLLFSNSFHLKQNPSNYFRLVSLYLPHSNVHALSAWQTHSWRSTTNDDCSIHSFCTTRKTIVFNITFTHD